MENSNIISKMLMSIATVASESSSFFCFYEPKVPAQLLKSNSNKKNRQTKRKDV